MQQTSFRWVAYDVCRSGIFCFWCVGRKADAVFTRNPVGMRAAGQLDHHACGCGYRIKGDQLLQKEVFFFGGGGGEASLGWGNRGAGGFFAETT